MVDKSGPSAQVVDADVKQSVKEFYDSVGWRGIGEGLYQNARYEDLRPVSREYIHRCHLRVSRHLPESGRFLLDAGSGPIQYPEYLEYSSGFRKRVCLDISILALKEARERIGEHGLFVVGDIANLPFRSDAFDGLVSLHTVHHLPAGEQQGSFREFERVLAPGSRAVVVYSWGDRSLLVRLTRWPIRWIHWAIGLYNRLRRREVEPRLPSGDALDGESERLMRVAGTYTYRHGYAWVRERLVFLPGLEIRVWRSMSTAMLRAFVRGRLGGRALLRFVYSVEERFPHLLGRIGQYPMILFRKGEYPPST
jgi:SAM-dependent methyltransferase